MEQNNLQSMKHIAKRYLFLFLLLPVSYTARAQKQVYIPEDLRSCVLESDTARWSWRRSSQTDNLVFFWERGFGNDLSSPPALEGKPMQVDLRNLENRVEHFYRYFRDTLKFTKPGSKADRYKMMVMINYSLDGTAYGGTYDNFIGALWVAPNRIQDKKLNCLAHELGHSFQSQIMADSVGEAWGGSGFFEMASQWMLWRVNPDWLTDENYHFEAFKTLTHKAFLHHDNIYHSPYVLEYWAEQRGLTAIGELFRQGRRGEDPVMTYQRMYGLSQERFCDEMFDCYRRLINFDFDHARPHTRRYACTFGTPTSMLKDGWEQPAERIPEAYGFNAITLAATPKVTVQVRGEHLRYGLVGITTDGMSVYGTAGTKADGRVSLKVPRGKTWAHVYLVVMGAPEKHVRLRHGKHDEVKYNYRFRVI
jgi:hypothetical protein